MNLKLMIWTVSPLCMQAATMERRGRQGGGAKVGEGGEGEGGLGQPVITISDKLNSCHLCQQNNHPGSLENNMPLFTTTAIMAKLVTTQSSFGLLCFCQI